MTAESGTGSASSEVRIIGRYALHGEIAAGGMATVHLARLLGVGGFARTVAVKRLHPQFAKDPEFVAAFLDEARLAARIRHPNVVPTLDVVATEGELFLVMEWIQGESLAQLRRMAKTGVPVPIACGVLNGALLGLHAAHEARNERGDPLGLVHRDISPQNVLVGIDGVPRVTDFGVAKAAGRMQTTQEGKIKGKLRYMAPEQLLGQPLDRRADIFAASIVLWETLVARRLFAGDDLGSVLNSVLNQKLEPPSAHNPEVSPELDALVMRGLSRQRDERWPTALEMAVELERMVRLPSAHGIGAWVQGIAGDLLGRRAERVQMIESQEASAPVPGAPKPSSEPTELVKELLARGSHSSISEATIPSTSEAAPVEKKGSGRVAGVAVAAVLLGGGIFWGVTRGRESQPTIVGARPGSVAQTASVEAPIASTSAPPVTSAAAAAPTASATPPTKAPPRAKATPAVNCNPPYTLVNSGGKVIKRWKPGCM